MNIENVRKVARLQSCSFSLIFEKHLMVSAETEQIDWLLILRVPYMYYHGLSEWTLDLIWSGLRVNFLINAFLVKKDTPSSSFPKIKRGVVQHRYSPLLLIKNWFAHCKLNARGFSSSRSTPERRACLTLKLPTNDWPRMWIYCPRIQENICFSLYAYLFKCYITRKENIKMRMWLNGIKCWLLSQTCSLKSGSRPFAILPPNQGILDFELATNIVT